MTDDNEIAVRKLFDGVNARDLSVLDRFFAADYVNRNAFPGQTQGPAGARIAVRDLVAAFPDLAFTVEDMLSAGDQVAVRLTVRGTQKGEFRGAPPSGRSFTIGAHEWFRMSGGQAVEGWMQWDMLGLMQQIGPIA